MAHLEERMVAIARPGTPDESLEGVFRPGAAGAERGAVVAPPHPLYGGSIEAPVVNELSWAAAKNGIASLAFNWRGVGASAGAPSGDEACADEDYGAALAHLAESVPGPIVACGYSFGSAAAVRAAEGDATGRIDRLVLVAPPPALIAPERIADLSQQVLVIAGADDTLVPKDVVSMALLDAPGITLEVIPRADHFFQSGLALLGQLVQHWLGGGAG